MRIAVVAIGQRLPDWARLACDEFQRRFPPEFSVSIRELKPEPRSNRPVDRIIAAEADRLRAAIPTGYLTVALDERGKALTSHGLAEHLRRWRDEGRSIAFLIGGPDGMADQLKREAQLLLRLSDLTLPHALARVILLEQLYRGWSIMANHPYHRD